jgi:hypothetical protein
MKLTFEDLAKDRIFRLALNTTFAEHNCNNAPPRFYEEKKVKGGGI